jgi:putative endonuclease
LNNFHYVYILVSETDETRHYTGITDDLESRLKAHNNEQVPHTSKYRPWRIETAIAFSCPKKASDFEKYLMWLSGKLQLNVSDSFLTTKNTKITKAG